MTNRYNPTNMSRALTTLYLGINLPLLPLAPRLVLYQVAVK